MKSIRTLQRSTVRAALLGFIFGVAWFIAMRVIIHTPQETHYHANFALYINSKQDPFDSFTFYEEVAACSSDSFDPKSRAHMHDTVSNVVHIHDKGVTWGHFFANIGYGLGDDYVKTDDGVFETTEFAEVSFILNGKKVPFAANQIIGDEDVLLVSYGNESEETLQERYRLIDSSAAVFNEQQDPAACSGSNQNSISDRLKDTLGI